MVNENIPEAPSVKTELKEEKLKFSINLQQNITPLPEIREKTNVDLRYPLILPYAYVHIYWDDIQGELIYNVEEPNLDDREKEILELIKNGIEELINLSFISVKEKESLIEYLEKNVGILLKEFGIKLEKNSYLKIMYYIYRDFIGMNKIEPLMNDYYIEDIECNGVKSPLYIVHRRFGNIKTNIIYEEFDELSNFVEKLAQKCGKYISYATPLLDGSLPDGTRVNATFTEDVTSKGPTFSLRKFTKEPWSPIKLMQMGTVSAEMLAYLWLLIENGSNLLVVGSTGSGKTTFLNVLASFISPQARIISIEDTREIHLVHENWLPSVARAGIGVVGAGGEKTGEITLFDLLRESFRQRPDYVIVGEIRGKEAYVLFQGMASGHSSLGTMHADDVATIIRRLETPPINLSPSLVETLDAVCLMTFAKVKDKETRKLRAIEEIISVDENGKAKINIPFSWDPRTNKFLFKKESNVLNEIVIKKGISREKLDEEFNLRSKLLLKLYQENIFDFNEVQKIIHAYYKTPERVLKRFNLR